MTEKLAKKLIEEAQQIESLLVQIDMTIFESTEILKEQRKKRDVAIAELRSVICRERAPLLTDQDAMGAEEAGRGLR